MNRRTRLIVALAIAVLCATGATAGLFYTIKKMNPPPKETPQIHVVVAARDVAMGMRLTADDIKVVNWPAATPVKGAYDDLKKVINRGLIAGVIANEPLTDQKMAPLEAGGGLAIQITEGMRAISVKVNEVIGVAGFVLPGAKVDVLVTIRQRDQNAASRVVVSNVQVLTAGTRYDQQQAKDGKPVPTTVVTLMVTPPDAERIALAATEGQLLLTLKYPLDKGQTVTTGVTTAALLGAPLNPPPAQTKQATPAGAVPRKPVAESTAKPVSPVVAPAVYEVDAIRGGKRSREVIR